MQIIVRKTFPGKRHKLEGHGFESRASKGFILEKLKATYLIILLRNFHITLL